MDFDHSDDRRMLSDTLRRFLSGEYPPEHRNKVAYVPPYHDPEIWTRLAELGTIGALVPEDKGGFGGSGFDIAVVFEEMGRANCPEPFLGTLLAARLLASAGSNLSDLVTGEIIHAAAISEPDAPYEPEFTETSASPAGDGHTLSGRKCAVYGGNVAAKFLVTAKLNGRLALFSVAREAAEVVPYAMIDGGGAAELLLDNTPATLLLADAGTALEGALSAGAVALCAEAVGLMDTCHAALLDYLKTRKQFGKTIGSFQVLQHRVVDMLTEIEQARSITIAAAAALGTGEAARKASMAKNLIGRAARLVSEECIQMHGGIAMTWEFPVSHYAKRLVMLDAQLGDTDHHLARVMATLG